MRLKSLKFIAMGIAVAAIVGACKPVHTSGVYHDPYRYPTTAHGDYRTNDGRVFPTAAARDAYIRRQLNRGYNVYAIGSAPRGLTRAERRRLEEEERLRQQREQRRLNRAERRRLRALEEERRRLEAEEAARRDARRERRAEREARRQAELDEEARRQRRLEREARRQDREARRQAELDEEARRQRRLEREARRQDRESRRQAELDEEYRRQRRLERRTQRQVRLEGENVAEHRYWASVYPKFSHVDQDGAPKCDWGGRSLHCADLPAGKDPLDAR